MLPNPPLPPPIPAPLPQLPRLTVSTQNVGGMRGEYQRTRGPKTSMLHTLTSSRTDFLILTETRADVRALPQHKIRGGLVPTLHSLQQEARGGVVIYSKTDHTLLDNSSRESTTPGHFIAGVYQVNTSRTIVAGVYGPSNNDDTFSTQILQELRDRGV